MLYYTILYYTILYYTILYYTILYYDIMLIGDWICHDTHILLCCLTYISLDDALIPEIAELCKNNKPEFEKQAKIMTKKYATG
jgi:hypothetical protein